MKIKDFFEMKYSRRNFSIIIFFMVVFLFVLGCFGGSNVCIAAEKATATDATASQTGDNNQNNQGNNRENTSDDLKSNTSLSIDNKNRYEGMDKTYAEGYVPTISGGKAIVVIPVICDGYIKNNTLKTSVSLGDTQSMPFVCKNYEKDIILTKNKVNGGGSTTESYLISYSLDLKADRVNGSYPVVLKIKAEDTNGNQIEEQITTYVTITDGKNPDMETETYEEGPSFAPKVLVQSYTYSKEDIFAGDEITANITLYNTSQTTGVKNMTVTVSGAENYLTLLSPTDTLYIDSIGAGEKHIVSFKYKVNQITPVGQYNVQLSMDYADSEGATYSSSGNAKLNISQVVKVEFDPIVIPTELEVADTIELSVGAMNLGKGKVYNVRANIDMEGFNPEGTIFIGDIEPGSMLTGSVNVTVSGLSGSSSYGNTKGTVTFIYEDENGKEYTELQDIETRITSPFINLQNNEEVDKPIQWWVIMLVIVAIVVGFGVMGVISYVRRKKLDEEE